VAWIALILDAAVMLQRLLQTCD